MKIPRQSERRARFQVLFQQMPTIETWTTETPVLRPYTPSEAQSMYEAAFLAVTNVISDSPPKPIIKHHFKLIPRRIRRDMARIRAKREYRADRNLPV